MNSQLQQLLETLIKFHPNEPQARQKISEKTHDIVRGESQRNKEDQQPETLNGNHQERPTTIPRTQGL